MLDCREVSLNASALDAEARTLFWSKVTREPNGCWTWTGRVGPYGGVFSTMVAGRRFQMSTHRIAWELLHGPLDDTTAIKHFCGMKMCVRPDHLYTTHEKFKNGLGSPTPELSDLAALFLDPTNHKEQNYVRDDEQDNLLTAFTMRGYLVILRFEEVTIPVAVTTDAAQTKSAAKMVALRRARQNDANRYLGRLLGSKVVRDTEEARFDAGIDDSEYRTYVERQNKWFDMDLYQRMKA